MLTERKTYDISIIIPTLNEAACIGQTVAGLVDQPGVEVIVADGGSHDRTAPLAATAGATVITAPVGRGSQQNAGARVAQGRVLLFLHADTRLPEGFTRQIHEALNLPGMVAGAFRFAVKATGWKFRLLETGTNWRAARLGIAYGDQALFLPAARFQAMGGFREIALLEDLDLVLRLRKIGKLALLATPALTSARRWQRLGLVRTTVINQLILLGFFCGISPGRLARWYGGLLGKQVAVQVLVRDKGKQKPGAFAQVGGGKRAGHKRVGIRQQPGEHHKENGNNHPRLDLTENTAQHPVKPAKQREAHDFFEHKADGQNPAKNREKKQDVGHQK
jgi:rSAM/selenodomain-associated transferase 2